MTRKSLLPAILLLWSLSAAAQLSGDFQMNNQLFLRDSTIGAYKTPQYNNQFVGTDAWLHLTYSIKGFTAGVRLDMFENSNLHDPTASYSNQGLGIFYLEKDIDKLNVTGGYFYEQFGAGTAFRAWEDRGLGIDNALFGVRLKYKLSDNWLIKAIAGRQKNLFGLYGPFIKGANIDGRVTLHKNISLNPGASFVNRTLDNASMDLVVATIETYPDALHFTPKYNTYVYSAYNTLNLYDFTWYVEGDYKTPEAILGKTNQLQNLSGNFIYTSLAYNNTKARLGITLQAKRTENFVFRTSPNEILLNGMLDYVPPIAKQNTLRLLARYTPATQYLGELGYEGDLVWTPKKGYTLSFNYSDIGDIDTAHLYREINGDIEITKFKKIKAQLGLQSIFYNFSVYRTESGAANVNALTPFGEITWKITRKRSLRLEMQYLLTKQDYGSWTYALLEYNIAPVWSFALSDMYNIQPNPDNPAAIGKHYPTIFAAYTVGANRFTLAYVKQVDGVNCTGGVCRYEPAFSGVRFTVTSSF